MMQGTPLLPFIAPMVSVTAALLCLAGCTRPNAHSQQNQHQTQGLLYCAFDVSPDGKTIVFSGAGNGGKDLYLLNLETNKVTQLTNTPEYENSPAFSPDGKTIVYQSAKSLDQPHYLFLRSLDGKHVRQLTNTLATSDDNPRFSPSGEQIVFARSQQFHAEASGENTWGSIDAFVINRDGSHLRQVTHLNSAGVMRPKFYPDNRHILFEKTVVPNSPWSLSDDSHMHINKADITGQEAVQEVFRFSTFADSDPYFYPDGHQIVFCGNFGGILDLYRVSLTGGVPSKLLANRNNTGFCAPVVTADGKSIFCLERYDPNLYKMNADGTGLHQIADSSLFSDPMHWKPTSK